MIINRALRIGSNVVGGTTNSILFLNGSSEIAQNNSDFNWDDVNNKQTIVILVFVGKVTLG